MKSAKQDAIDLIRGLSDDASLDEILEELLYIQLVKERIATADEDEVVPHEEAKKRLGRWLASSGR